MSKNLSHLSLRNSHQAECSEKTFFSPSVKAGSQSFYDFTRPENADKKVHVCNGTACLVAGTQEQVRTRLAGHFTRDEIGHVCCLGRCHENKSFMYNNKTYSGNDIDHLAELINGSERSLTGQIPATGLVRETMLMPPAADMEEICRLAASYADRPQPLIDELQAARLRGRGGAGFPFYLKLESFSAAAGCPKYVVCNADEGDPGAFSDRYLLEEQPHLVLFGMLVCGLANDADEGILYIRHEYPEAMERVRAAIDELKKYSSFTFRICKGKGAYVCGEETALINSIEGQRPEVRVRPPYPTSEGLYNRPTLLSNVETFANLYWILKNGGAAYARYGSDTSTGNKLVCLDACFNRPGVHEVEFGTSLGRIFSELGGGFSTPLKAVQIGGPLGGIIPLDKLDTLTLDFESLQGQGFLLGHASVVGIPEGLEMIRFVRHLLEFARDESCGKCYPCRIGSQRGYEFVHNAIENDEKIPFEFLSDLLWTMQHGSLCALGGGLPLPINNVLTYFQEELSRHIGFSEDRP
ncbi:MAG: NADH-ubiquinone oxidoreductase-F iron-sulfur binding region domain-containing protein [Desulfuromonadaceae bacterium]|nr:NADH-ubiquinone oxidoreductase-F iron-sulfur binding region domain-containing protein [Desulfuromonadaceae bacterium]